MADSTHKRDWVAIIVSGLAMFATSINAFWSYSSFELNSETQRSQLTIATENQKTAMFAQFQQQYTFIVSRFPSRFLDPTFQPMQGSDDYARLEAYWLFCYSEWYATNRLVPDAYRDLWQTYYTPHIMNALSIRSLRYVLQDMIRRYSLKRGDYHAFFNSLADIARQGNNAFDPDVQRKLDQKA